MVLITCSAVMLHTLIHREIRRKLGSFIWEQMNDSLMEQLDELTPVEIKTSIKEDAQRIKGKKDLDGSSKEKRVSKTPVGGKLAFCPLQDYPVNNMVTGYVSSSEMKKYLGELHDFIPGTSGYSVPQTMCEERENLTTRPRKEEKM
ncbi:E3 ubiquitin-protein ligase CCNB1IP1 [Platysternon megacephalum]|uniref:E3 ubiquitin-protein ligase CCNB1IP1 n=1 Tax=Platysternon megacephalum TaxID=55544 RepID=A0A4D9DTJ8_9SAUR|nr:E3 ubiquitin-protein ligase CCNB1IP1 [Platysternon megacephalum]